jgi:hypothetical protein
MLWILDALAAAALPSFSHEEWVVTFSAQQRRIMPDHLLEQEGLTMDLNNQDIWTFVDSATGVRAALVYEAQELNVRPSTPLCPPLSPGTFQK